MGTEGKKPADKRKKEHRSARELDGLAHAARVMREARIRGSGSGERKLQKNGEEGEACE